MEVGNDVWFPIFPLLKKLSSLQRVLKSGEMCAITNRLKLSSGDIVNFVLLYKFIS